MAIFRQQPVRQQKAQHVPFVDSPGPPPPPPPPPEPSALMTSVLLFTASFNHHVNHGVFWPINTDLPRRFFWDAWVCPAAEGGYVISEGYGGLHSLLFGFGGVGATPYNNLTGNVWDGSTVISFGSDDGPIPGEWAHVAVGADENRIVCYVNGVPSGAVAYTHLHRFAQQGTMFVGGSGHSNFGGKIAQIRGFEGFNPMIADPAFDAANRMLIAYRPEMKLAAFAKQRGSDGPLSPANFLADYTVPATVIADHSPVGYAGSRHPGQLWSTYGVGDGSINDGFGRNVVPSKYPLPKFVVDLTAPTAQVDASPIVPVSAPLKPPLTPPGALVFDSFSRSDRTFCFEDWPILGSTESGSLGPQAWQYNAPASSDGKGDAAYRWGILKGQGVALGGPGYQCAFVNAQQSNLDVRIDRRVYPAAYHDGRTGLAFRVQDGRNFWFVCADGVRPDQQTIKWGFYLNGTRNDLSNAAAPANGNWKTLRATVSAGSQITIWCDTTQVAQFTHSQFSSATGAGLFMDEFGSGFSGLARFDNFSVLNF